MNHNTYNINIEKVVLSSLLFDADIYEIKTILKVEDFYFPAHQKIYEAMLKLHSEDMPIDEEFVRKKLNAKEVDESIFIDILTTTPVSNLNAYVQEIKDNSTKRKLANLTTTIKKVTLEEDVKVDEAIATISKEFDSICDSSIDYDFKELFEQAIAFDMDFKSEGKANSFPCGFQPLTRAGVSYEPGDLVIIGARPSIGKTSLTITMISEYITKHGIGVLFDSLEMPTHKIIRSLIAVMNEESKSDLKNKQVKNLQKYYETINFLKHTKHLTIHDRSYMPIEYYLAKARKIFRKNPHYKIWMLDHLKFIKSNGNKQRYEQVGIITKSLKSFAKEFGITIILLSQMGRPDSKKVMYRPSMSELRESGDVEEDADIIILPHREDYYTRNQKDYVSKVITDGELIVEKYRDGESKICKTQFHGAYGKWGSFPVVEVTYQSNNQNDDVEVPEVLM